MLKLNIRNKLLFFSIALAIIPLAIAGRTMIRITRDELKSSANDELGNAARQLADEIEARYRDTWLAPLVLIGNSIDDPALGVEEKVSLLTSGIRDIRDLAALQVSARGVASPILVTNDDFSAALREGGRDPAAVLRLSPEAVLERVADGSIFAGDLVHVAEIDAWLITIAVPLRNPLAGRRAALSARIELDRLADAIADHPLNRSGRLTVVGPGGRTILVETPREMGDHALAAGALELLGSETRTSGVEPFVDPEGRAMLGAFAFAAPFDWIVLAERTEEDAYLAVSRMVTTLGMWVLAGLAIAVVGAVLFALRISRPIQKIDRVAREVSEGNLHVRVEGVRTRDEIGALAVTMNEMIQGLLERFHMTKFVSGGTLSAIKSSGEAGVKLGGERREVTVFFSDIRGFTAFSETVEPETVVDMLNTFLRHQAEIVNGHGGDIDKFVGDELVAVFQGEEMTRRAVQAAIDIQERMAELVEDHPEWQIAVGIGINVGEVVLGAMGSEDRMDYTMLGDPVNLGARLCSAAERGQTLLSEAAYERVAEEEGLDIEALEPIRVKGKSEPIRIWGVRGGHATR